MPETQPRWRGVGPSALPAAPVRAGIIDAPGAEPRLGTVSLGPRRPGTTLVTVLAAPGHPLDLLLASGGFHSARHESAYVPGSELVGVVVDSDQHPPGATVYGECHASPTTPGAFATHVVVADDDLLSLPPGVDPVLAAAVGNSGVAAYLPLVTVARLEPGETVLVLGATGAVGQLAVQIAKHQGAGRVVGVARNPAALDRLLALGADAVVDLRPAEGPEHLASRLQAAAGPVDVVLDSLFGAPLEAALPGCAQRARIINIGNLAGATAQLPAGLLRGRQLSVTGFAGLHMPLSAKRDALSWLWTAVSRGELRIDVDTFTLGELPAAWSAQRGSPHAKCVVLPQEAAGAAGPDRRRNADGGVTRG